MSTDLNYSQILPNFPSTHNKTAFVYRITACGTVPFSLVILCRMQAIYRSVFTGHSAAKWVYGAALVSLQKLLGSSHSASVTHSPMMLTKRFPPLLHMMDTVDLLGSSSNVCRVLRGLYVKQLTISILGRNVLLCNSKERHHN